MDKEKLWRLEIEETDLDAIEDALEEKQNDLETRMDTAESNGNMERKKQLELELAEVEELLRQVKEEKKAAASKPEPQPEEKEEKARGAVPTVVDETVNRTVPTAIDGLEEFTDNVKKVFGGPKSEKTQEAKEKAKAKEKEKAKEAEDKKHEAELKEKAAKLRKKAAEEEAAKTKAEKEAAKADEKKAEKTGGGVATGAELSEYEKLLNEGITAYATGKHKDAFEKIFKVANAGKDAKLSKDDLGQAEQLLARMYKNGEGTPVDTNRAWFWFEKAADHGNVEGCLAMGQHNAELTPKSPAEENTFRENALKYFKIAGNSGSKVAKEKYVDICIKKKNQISFGDVLTACKFLDDLIELESDSFVKQSLAEKKKELTDKEPKKKKTQKRNSTTLYNGFGDALAIIGAVLAALGVMLFCNFVLEYQDTFFNFAKVIPEYFKVNEPPVVWGEEILQEFDNFAQPYGSNPGRWSMLMIPAGFLLSAFSNIEKRGIIANLLCEISLYFSVIAGFVTFYYYYVCLVPYEMEIQYGVAMAVCILVLIQIPRLPGILFRRFIG